MSVSCSFSRDIYAGGNIVSAFFRLESHESDSGSFSKSQCNLSIQAYSYLSIDPKWARTSQTNTKQIFPKGSDGIVVTPLATLSNFTKHSQSGLVGYLLFLSDIQRIDNAISCGDGFVAQFDLPIDIFPTLKGLSFSISHGLIIEMRDCVDEALFKSFPFPFQVINSAIFTDYLRIR
jgi:hypothetical protein